MREKSATARALERSAHGAYAEWLSRVPWSVFATWTFDRKVGPTVALHAIERWIGYLDREVRSEHKVRAAWPGVGYVVGLEQHTDHVSPHGHGLLVGVEGVYLWPHWQRWQEQEGRGKFEVVKSDVAVGFYCSKYATKETHDPEFKISANLGSWLSSRPLRRVELYARAERGRRGTSTAPELAEHQAAEHGGKWARGCATCRELGARGYLGVPDPEVESDRRTARAPAVRSFRMSDAPRGGADSCASVLQEERRLRARRWWSERKPGRWILCERDREGFVVELAAVYRDFVGGWNAQCLEDGAGPVQLFDDARVARRALEEQIGVSRAA